MHLKIGIFAKNMVIFDEEIFCCHGDHVNNGKAILMKFMFLTSLNDGMSVSQILFSFCLHTACHSGVNVGGGVTQTPAWA